MGDLADTIPSPPESDVRLVREPYEDWPLDALLERTIELVKLRREMQGWRDDEAPSIAPLQSLEGLGRNARRRARQAEILAEREAGEIVTLVASWETTRGSRPVRE